ncbi:hypothetical protein D3C80_910500 [compost metagenome]
MPDFDAALDLQGALAVRARVAGHDVAQVGNGRNRQVAFPVHAEVVFIIDVGTDAEVAHQLDRTVDDDRQRQVQRAEGAGTGANGLAQFAFRGHDQRAGNAWLVGGLDFVQLMVATDDQGNQLAFLFGVHHEGLDGFLDRQVEAFDQLRNGLGVRRVDQAQLFGRSGTRGFARHGFGFFDVGGVVGAVAEHDVVFTGLGQYVELVGAGTADGAVVGFYRAELQAQTGEHVAVGLVHAVVGDLQRRLVGVEGVGVLHDEFAAAHQAEAWADFVTEFGLDLVQVDRQLLVAAQFVAHQIGDDFFVGRAGAEVATVAILEAQQFRAVLFPAPGFLPQLSRLRAWHQHFERAGSVHFFTNDGFDLAHYPQAHRQPGVQA